nr:retrovirus-related Pol polyprotein from transposon TNT 1-94 [Tanacetum cinerariifolium]
METEEFSKRYITLCFVDGLNAYDGEINLEYEKNMISNEFAVKLCLENEEDAVEPVVIFRRSFLRLTKGNFDFRNGILTIYHGLITFNDDSDDELDAILASIDVSDLPPLDKTDIPPFMCSIGKIARNKKQPSKNYKMSYNEPKGLRNVNHTQTLDLADIYERFVYEDNLIQRRISKKILMMKSMKGLSSSNSNSQADLKFQKDYKAEYKKMKATLTLLEASPSSSQNPKTFQPKNKCLVTKTFNWDEKEVSDKEEVTHAKVLMDLDDDELTVGKSHARNDEWFHITIRKLNTFLSMDEDANWQNYQKYINIDLKFVEEND